MGRRKTEVVSLSTIPFSKFIEKGYVIDEAVSLVLSDEEEVPRRFLKIALMYSDGIIKYDAKTGGYDLTKKGIQEMTGTNNSKILALFELLKKLQDAEIDLILDHYKDISRSILTSLRSNEDQEKVRKMIKGYISSIVSSSKHAYDAWEKRHTLEDVKIIQQFLLDDANKNIVIAEMKKIWDDYNNYFISQKKWSDFCIEYHVVYDFGVRGKPHV